MRMSKKMIVASLATSLFAGMPLWAHEPINDRYDSRNIDRHDSDHCDSDRRVERRADWARLGTIYAGRNLERDVIDLGRPERLSALRFDIEHGDMVLEGLKVTFGDDSIFTPDLKRYYHAGDRSCVIDLPGSRVKRIRLLYRSAAHCEAVVTVFGTPIH